MFKLTVHLKSGQNISLKCKNYDFTYDRVTLNFTGYTLTKPSKIVSIVPNQIAAYTAE
jgi:hypothetical protein